MARECPLDIAFPPKSSVAWAGRQGERVDYRAWGAKQFAGVRGSKQFDTTPVSTCCRTRLRESGGGYLRGRGRSNARRSQELARRDGQSRGQDREGHGKDEGGGQGKSKDKKSAADKPAALAVPLAQGPAPQTPEAEVALVKSAIGALRSGGASKATEVAATISDPVARKLVEWIILRSDHNGANSKRYLAFIAANPGWPNLGMFRRRAEGMLWVENVKPAQALSFFNDSPPQSGVGRLVLARALFAQGDTEGASALVREAWRYDPLPAEVEKHVLERYSEFLSRADHKARMEKRLFAADNDAAMRAARRLGGADLAIAQARIALNRKAGNAKKLLDAVPAEARDDAGYLFARAHLLRHDDKIAEAAKVLLSAPRDLAQVHDGEEWWVERRIMSRKLLDLGDARSAYLMVAEAAEPTKENSRVERHFMAGWIALRYLDDPATAATHFTRIRDVSSHPTSRARSHYWLGRVAEALSQPDQARAQYEAAAGASAAYYGQLARAKLGHAALALAPPPATPDKHAEAERLEVVRGLEILYALNERPLAIALMAGLGGTHDDVGTLSAVGELAEQYHDARGMLHMGKAALARGLPLDYYAFPTVGVPRYSPIAPEIEDASAVCHHSPGERVRSVRLVARPGDGSDAGDAGRRTGYLQALQLHLQRQTPQERHTLQPSSGRSRARRLDPGLSRQPHPGVRGLQCRARARAGLDREVRRSARPEGRSHRLGRAHPVHGNPQLRAARDGEPAGLSHALRQRRAAHHRGRPAARRHRADLRRDAAAK